MSTGSLDTFVVTLARISAVEEDRERKRERERRRRGEEEEEAWKGSIRESGRLQERSKDRGREGDNLTPILKGRPATSCGQANPNAMHVQAVKLPVSMMGSAQQVIVQQYLCVRRGHLSQQIRRLFQTSTVVGDRRLFMHCAQHKPKVSLMKLLSSRSWLKTF